MNNKGFSKTKKITLIIIASILLLCILFFTIVTTVASTNRQENLRFVKSFDKVDQENNIWPNFENGYYTFVCDRPFKVMQLSDIQLGGGWLTKEMDSKALNAIAAMVSEERPNLVVITGDMSLCDPGKGASLNNLEPLRLICKLLDTLQVYYTFTFGNQDSERQCLYSREYLASFITDNQFYYCLYERGDKDVSGVGNQVFKIKNTNGIITQAIICMDSNSYEDNKIKTAIDASKTNKYGYLKEDQINWYKSEIQEIDKANKEKDPNASMVKSIVFMHLPIYEVKLAVDELKANDFKPTENVELIEGIIVDDVHSSTVDTNFFETVLELKSTQAICFGHDVLNTFALKYKGVSLEYSGSIDYLSKKNISKFGKQRGCRIIMINPNGTLISKFENYYQDKYKTKYGKEEADLNNFYSL